MLSDEVLARASRAIQDAADTQLRAAGTIAEAVQQLQGLLGHGYGNLAERLVELLGDDGQARHLANQLELTRAAQPGQGPDARHYVYTVTRLDSRRELPGMMYRVNAYYLDPRLGAVAVGEHKAGTASHKGEASEAWTHVYPHLPPEYREVYDPTYASALGHPVYPVTLRQL